MTREQRDAYRNLVLLCNVHHKQIDDQPGEFTVERLITIKADHEEWVQRSLGIDAEKQRDDEAYAAIIDEWVTRSGAVNWDNVMSGLMMADQPRISADALIRLTDIRPWLLARVWPRRYPELESAFENFRRVCQDLVLVFQEHMEDIWGTHKQTEKFYKIHEWDEERYRRLSREYDWHVHLVYDLVAELTRAVNYVSDTVRRHLLPSFLLHEGVALITTGPDGRLQYTTMRLEYRDEERGESPYPGLEGFYDLRATRDFSAGTGRAPN